MKKTVANTVFEQLRKNIKSGAYPLGEKLPSEAVLCSTLSVSRTSLREALRSLEAAGYVEIKPGRGAFVSEDLPSESKSASGWLAKNKYALKDILEARRAIEPLCASLAAKNASEDEVTFLWGLLYRYEDAYAKNDPIGMAESDDRLHMKIAELSKNEVLISILSILNEKLTDHRANLFAVEGNGVLAISMHKDIVSAIAKGSAQEAEAAMLNHVNGIFKNLNDLTEK